ncbi:hypothetical protein Tco_0352386 [Tanacetum coccineum]
MNKRARSGKSTRGQSSSSHEPKIEEWVRDLRAFDNDTHQMNYNALVLHSIHPRTIIDWNKPQHAGIQFRLGGEQRMLSLVELGWRVGLYSKAQRGEHGAVTSLYNSVIVKAERLIMEFLLTSVDGVFAVEHTVAKQIRDSRIRFAHRCIATTISGCKDSTQRITVMDLFYLYCIYEIVMELVGGGCHWLATRPTQPLEEDDKDEEAAKVEAGGEGVFRCVSGHELRGLEGSSGYIDGPTRHTMGTTRDLDDHAGSVVRVDVCSYSLGRHLEEIHVTWTQFGKNRDKIATLHEDDQDLAQNAVDWKSSKQSTTTMSAKEAEYIATLEAAMEAVWIRKLFHGAFDIEFVPSNVEE